ncbi:MAG TPA: radical SAM protein [Vicinamibacterales bacterium]|nr:radical SAM protein [Vicinamibacterales bacterium]
MEIAPLLFDLGTKKPTTREIADRVRAGGADALTDAVRRADAARYQEVRCRSALNRVKGMPFEWTLNPYRGCTHGCHYCYARRYHTQFELGASDEFASVIFVKTNLVDVLRRELQRPSWRGDYVAVGTATDCYQPIEGHYKLTRRSLQTLLEFRNPVGIVTKGPMVVRDVDVLADLTAAAGCSVYVSVPCVDEDVWRSLEPGTAHPLQRLRAVRELVDAGIRAGVLMNPIVPGISSKPALIERTIKAVADHGARFVGCNTLYLEGGTRDHFMRFLADEYPHLVEGYAQLYAAKYAPQTYRKEVQHVIGTLRARYGLTGRSENGVSAPQPIRDAEQQMLTFSPRRRQSG